MLWVTPPRRATMPVFDPAAFAAGRDTLYLVTEARSAASPLIAALTDTVMRAGRRHAEQAAGRLDPPMVVVLDEAANICRIADLPELYSHLGSRGMVPVTILQSYQQGVAVWGEPGMAALWGASTKKVIGAGIDDPRHARDLATLVGQHDVPVASVSYGDGRASRQVSLRRQEILEAADIRALPPGSGLLLATGARPALISTRPWYTGPHAPRITAAIARAEAAMRRAAQISAGPPGPPARAAPGQRDTRS
jgi:type IV secretory pathway TraG/TraD family ATPase VirD4